MARDTKEINKLFVKSMQAIAIDLEKPISEITKPQFFANNPENISEWDIRKAGGFDSLKKMNFAPEDNIEVKYGSKLVRSHINKLNKEHGRVLFFEKELVTAVKDILTRNPLVVHPPIKKTKRTASKTKRTILAAISDTHYGANVSREELHGLNEFNWTIAARRTAFFMKQIVEYKEQHREETDLCLQLNGDIIAGVIHDQTWFVDLLTTQYAGTLSILAQAITFAAQHFSKVRVICTPGNHGRAMHKPDKGRATTNKWDSYENMIYIALREILAQNYPNVTFDIPESPFLIYKVQGHNVCQTHGDTVINVGNPGKSLNTSSINNQINQMNNSELIKPDEKIAIVSVGHVHVPTVQTLQSGCALVINGCLSGIDPFAQSIGCFSNNPTQMLVEITPDYSIGDIRMIQVRNADKSTSLDSIIKPFTGKL